MTNTDPVSPQRAPDPEQLLRLLPVPEPPPRIASRLRDRLAQDPPPTRAVIARHTLALALGSWALTLLLFFLAGGPRSLGRPLSLVTGTALGIAAAAAIAGWAALGRGNSMLGRARRFLMPLIVGSPAVILAWKLFWSTHYPGALIEWPTRPGYRCLLLSLSLGICPLISFAMARRSSDPKRPMFTGFAAGVAIGCVASLLTDMWCPVAYLPHLLIGHLLPIALLGMLGAWMGWRFIALERMGATSSGVRRRQPERLLAAAKYALCSYTWEVCIGALAIAVLCLLWGRVLPGDESSAVPHSTESRWFANQAGSASGAGHVPPGSESGWISDFEDRTTQTRFGLGWQVTAEPASGSNARIDVVAGGANGSYWSLAVRGEVKGVEKAPELYAGAFFNPGSDWMTPVDLSARSAIEFDAKGNGETYVVVIFTARTGRLGIGHEFETSTDWRHYRLRFAEFSGLHPEEITGIGFGRTRTPGKLDFELDNVKLD